MGERSDDSALLTDARDEALRMMPAAESESARPFRGQMWTVVRIMICGALLAYIFQRYDASSVVGRLLQVQFRWLVVAGGVAYLGILVSAWRWKRILDSYGRSHSLLQLWALYLEGNFLNLFFPGIVAGDVSRAARTSRKGKASVDAFMAVFLDRFVGLLVAGLLVGTVAILGGYKALGPGWRGAILLAIIGGLGVLVMLLHVRWATQVVTVLPRSLSNRVEQVVEKIRNAVETVTSDPRLLAQLVGLSLLYICAAVGATFFVAQAVHFPVPLSVLLVYVPLVRLFVSLPISIQGVGVRENLFVFFLSALGFLPEDIIAFALSLSALMVLVNLSGGAVLLCRAARPELLKA